ncbi:MAG: murein biosynthesis integral membrane protein MurJ [Anaerolineales bacterium]
MTKRGILKASLIQMIFNAAAIGVAFLREVLIANYFGTGMEADAYLVAYALPLVLYTVMTTVLPLVLVPALERARPDTEDGKRLLAGTNTVLVLSLGALTAVMWLGAPAIIRLQAPGFDAPTARLASELFSVMVPIVLLLSLAWVACSWLFSLKRFVLPALAKVVFNLAGVVALVAFASRYGVRVAASGVLIGAILQVAILIPSWVRARMPFWSWRDARSPQVRALVGASLIMIPVQANLYLYLIVDRFLASMLPQGTIAILSYADKVIKAFSGVTIAALGVVIFPYLAEMASVNHHDELDRLIRFAIRLTALIILPVQLGLMAAGQPLVRLLFERGAFLPEDTALTTVAMNYQLIGLFASALSMVFYRVLFAFQRYKMALGVSAIAIVINIALKAALMPALGFIAMPLGTSIAATLEVLIVAYALRHDVRCFRDAAIYRDVGKVLAAALAGGAAAYLVLGRLGHLAGIWSAAWVQVLALVVACGAVYVVALALLRVEDVGTAAVALGRLLKRRLHPAGEEAQA